MKNKHITLTEYLKQYPQLNRATVIRWVKAGVLHGYQSCRCLTCGKLYRLVDFSADNLGYPNQPCGKCKSILRAGGDFYVVPTAPENIKQPKRGRRWPAKKETQ